MCQTTTTTTSTCTTSGNSSSTSKVLLPEQAASAAAAENQTSSNQAQPPIILWTDFINPTKPWVLVPDGSLNGYWNWVPPHLRVGPWSIACCCYLAALYYAVLLFSVDCFFNQAAKQPQFPVYFYWTPATGTSWAWWLNAAGTAWTFYVALCVARSPMGWGAWMSFTLQSWTMIVLRFALSTVAPWLPSVVSSLAEVLRFPMLAQATITFGIWNAVLMPVMLMHMPNNQHKEDFRKLIFGFLLTQLHVCNFLYAAVSGVYGSPRRLLTNVDLAYGLLWALGYIAFYLFILDRLGIHFYFIFSPRSTLSLLTWSLFLGLYLACFPMWKHVIQTYGLDKP